MEPQEQLNEEWRPIPGYPSYQVSSLGRVASTGYFNKIWRKGRILKPFHDSAGYFQVGIYQPRGVKNQISVHRLVAIAFHGPCPVGLETAHLNGIRTDNGVENLQYVTSIENQSHRVPHGTSNRGERCVTHKLSADQVLTIAASDANPKQIANKLGVHQRTVRSIRRGENWSWLTGIKPERSSN